MAHLLGLVVSYTYFSGALRLSVWPCLSHLFFSAACSGSTCPPPVSSNSSCSATITHPDFLFSLSAQGPLFPTACHLTLGPFVTAVFVGPLFLSTYFECSLFRKFTGKSTWVLTFGLGPWPGFFFLPFLVVPSLALRG